MELSRKINLFIYRFRERGLEVFLVNQEDEASWSVPQEAPENEPVSETRFDDGSLIELDPVTPDNGTAEKAWAVEADWHEIPSLRAMLYKDALDLKDKLFDEMEGGAFFAAKEAFKKLLPHQYQQLKELVEILADRNSTKNI